MAFLHVCEVTGPAVSTPIGPMGDETCNCEVRPVERFTERNDVKTSLTDADYAILPFSYVVQAIPKRDEFSAPNWNQQFIGNVPTIFGNFYKRAFDPDTCGLLPAGVTQDGIDDPARAREDPTAAARTAVLLHGTTSTLGDDRFFRHAYLGMFVELIPTDSGLRPEGYSTYGPALMRPVLAEQIRGNVFYTSTAPSLALVAAGYEYLANDDVDMKLPATDRVALMAEIWQLCKVPSMPTDCRNFSAGSVMGGAGMVEPTSRMSVRSHYVFSDVLKMENPYKYMADVYEGKTKKYTTYLNPWALFNTVINAKEHVNEFLLGSPSCPSVLMHVRKFLRKSVNYIIPSSDPVFEHCKEAIDAKDRTARWGDGGEKVFFMGDAYWQHAIRSVVDQRSFDDQLTKCGTQKITVADGGTNTNIKWTLGVDLKTRKHIVNLLVAGLTEEDSIAAFGPVDDLGPADVDILKIAGETLRNKAQTPLTVLHMAQVFENFAFFLDHPFLGEHIRAGGGTALLTSDATHISVQTSKGKATITVEAALGSLNVHSNDRGKAMGKYDFSPYVAAPSFSHPIIENLLSLVPTRKRSRDHDLVNDRELMESPLDKVMAELDRRPVRSKWIIGEFITVESHNTIRICMRKPFVYM